MKAPKISVLIPNYNHARYLPEAVESVLEQDFADFEVLIADDASTDGSAQVIAKYAAGDRRVRVRINSTNCGVAENFNGCLAQARGEHIKFLLSDDKLAHRGALGALVGLLERYPTACLAASARLLIGDRSERLGVCDDFHRGGLHAGPKTIAECLYHGANLIGEPSAVIFRKRALAGGDRTSWR